jgi:hypothetical protein
MTQTSQSGLYMFRLSSTNLKGLVIELEFYLFLHFYILLFTRELRNDARITQAWFTLPSILKCLDEKPTKVRL